MKTARFISIGMSIGWLGILCLPLLGKLFSFAPKVVVHENRNLSTKPSLSLHNLTQFPHQYETYYNDQFPFRTQLIQTNSYLMLTLLQSSPHKDVFIGRDGWFFYIPQNARIQTLDDAQLAHIKEKIETIHTTLSRQGIRFYFLITPNAQTIYADHLPRSVILPHPSPFDQILQVLDPSVAVVDPRATLMNAKKTMPPYRKYDTHWNDYGAFSTYQQLTQRLSAAFAQIQPRSLEDYEVRAEPSPHNDVLAMLAMKEYFSEQVPVLVPRFPPHAQQTVVSCKYGPNCEHLKTTVSNPRLPRLLMYRDSFSNKFIPFIGEHFTEAHYLWTYHVSQRDIDTYRPDVVILQVVERDLVNLANLKPLQ